MGNLQWTLALLILICGLIPDSKANTTISTFTTSRVNGTIITTAPPPGNTTGDVNGTVITTAPPLGNTTGDVNGTVITTAPPLGNTTGDVNGTVITTAQPPGNTTGDINGTIITTAPPPGNTTGDVNGTVITTAPPLGNTTGDVNGTVITTAPPPGNTTGDVNGTIITTAPPPGNTTGDVNGTIITTAPPPGNTTGDINGTVITTAPAPGNTTGDVNGTIITTAPPPGNTTSITRSTTGAQGKGDCVNGYLSDSMCICDENFHGSQCDLISNEIRPGGGPFTAKVKATVVVLNKKYSMDLINKTSEEYKTFEAIFEREIRKLYGSVTGYGGVRITSIKQGSVVVEHEVLINIYLINGTEQYTTAVRELNDSLSGTNCTSNDPGFLEFDVSRNKVQESELDFAALCSEFIPEDMRQYFSGANKSNKLLCVSNCSSKNPEFFNCNAGQCSISKAGPHCYCKTSDQFWYTGDRCANSVSKAGVISGVTIGLAVLALTIITLLIIVSRRGKNKTKERLIDNEQSWFDVWDGEKFEKGQINNSDSNSTSGVQRPEYDSVDFRPALDKVDPTIKVTTARARVGH